MWNYRPEYDTKLIRFEETFDCDYRLGEYPGDCDWNGVIDRYTDSNGHEIELSIFTVYQVISTKRSYIRHVKKRDIKPYIKIRKLDWTGHKVLGTCRIYFHKPDYVLGYNENMKLSNDEIDKFINCINEITDYYVLKKYREKHNTETTLWNQLIDYTNDTYRFIKNNRKYFIPINLSIPDYNQLKRYNKKED